MINTKLNREKDYMMLLNDLKKNMDLINEIDWDMTPEDAVWRYLEWGGNWRPGKGWGVKNKNDVSHYFVVNTWEEKPVIYLIRRNSEEAVELAKFYMPQSVEKKFLEACGNNKGVYCIEGAVKDWLRNELFH